MKERKWPSALLTALWVAGAFIGAGILVAVTGYIFTRVGVRIADDNVANAVFYAVSTGLAITAILGFPRLLRLWSGRISYRRLLGLTGLLRWRDIPLAAAGFIVSYALLFAASYLTALVPGFDANQPQDTGFTSTLMPGNALIVVLSLVLVAPVLEEIIFRGYLFGTLRRSVPVWVAAIVTSILFGLAHGQWNIGVDVFILSMVSCYLRYRTGSLWASILLHVIKNGVATYFLYVANHVVL